jgi:hypothetical protein
MRDEFSEVNTLASAWSALTVKQGLTSPYLMDEILGLAAAHKSTMVQDVSTRDFYHREATRLQTRALAQFNAIQAGIEEQQSLSVFLFSTLLGQHVLFDTFSRQDDFSTVLDRFVHCLNLHRGIRTIASESLSTILAQMKEIEGPDSAMIREMGSGDPIVDRGEDCAALIELLHQRDLSTTEVEAYRHAVDALQQLFDSHRSSSPSSHRRFAVIQEWPVRLSVAYVDFLAQRRPESLVILAFYAMLLHRARHVWAIAGAGCFLIESITFHLGSYWKKWLEIPNKMLEVVDAGGTRTGQM